MIGWVGQVVGGPYEPETIRSGRIAQVRFATGECRIHWDGYDKRSELWHDPAHINPNLSDARFIFKHELEKQIRTAEATITRLKERLSSHEQKNV